MRMPWIFKVKSNFTKNLKLKPRVILITGATGAIGGALAEHYASPGITLILHGRNPDRLKAIIATCKSKGARVTEVTSDVIDSGALIALIGRLDAEENIDLFIACAGVNTNIGDNYEGERWECVNNLIDTNIRGVMAAVHAVLPGMRTRRRGQIVLISSLAGYFGLPITPAYSASKAAVKTYGEALRGWLAPEGIRVNVVMPGYVSSAMCDAMPGPKPFMCSPAQAAMHIRRGVARDHARISFPFPLNLGAWFLAILPAAISIRLVRFFGYREF